MWHKRGPFTVFDLETTGMSPLNDRIVEIGAVRVDLDGSISRFESLVNPGVPIPSRVSGIHGITNAMVAQSPNFTAIGYQFLEFAQGSHLVAHNARFDFAFLQESLARVGLPLWKGGIYDSIPIIKAAYPGHTSYSLQALRTSLALNDDVPGSAHRAAFDAELTMEAFAMSMKRIYELYSEK